MSLVDRCKEILANRDARSNFGKPPEDPNIHKFEIITCPKHSGVTSWLLYSTSFTKLTWNEAMVVASYVRTQMPDHDVEVSSDY